MLTAAAWRRFRRNRPAMLGLSIVLGLVLFALLGPLLVGAQPNQSHFELPRHAGGGPPGPSWDHPLGTDILYRDLLARLASGARLSLLVGLAATAIAVAIGTAVGVLAGIAEGSRRRVALTVAGRSIGLRVAWLDDVLMRIVDIALAFPFLLLITAVGVAVGRSDALTVLLILGLTGWTGISRIVRAKTMQLKRTDFATAAVALGASWWRLVWRHILPAVVPTLLIIGSHAVAQMILAEAVLSYLTVGIHPPQATWGRMLHEAETYVGLRLALVAAPGFAILLAVLGFTRVGDGLRDAMATPEDPSGLRRSGRWPVDLAIIALVAAIAGFAPPPRLAAPIGEPAPQDAVPTRGGMLRVATMVNVRVLDPALAYDEASGAIGDHLFARLVDWDAQGQLQPDLAESFEVSDEGKTVVFRLRRGLEFHDGAQVTARDVKRSLERTLHPKTPSPGASLYRMIAGFEAFRNGEVADLAGVRAVDTHTVRFELDHADATFLPVLTLSFAAPVCPSTGATVNTRTPPDPCGAGPFRFESWAPGQQIVLRRFEHFHRRGLPYLDGIEWHTSVPAHTQRYRFEAGELDYVRDLSAADVALYRSDDRWRTRGRWFSKPATSGIFLNTELEPFRNVHMRRAVSLAIDPRPLSQIRPNVTPAARMVPDTVPGPEPRDPIRRHDPEAALREMALAGYPYDPQTDTGGYPELIDYITVPDTFDQAVAEVFQQQLARVGLRIRLRLLSYASWLAEVSRRGKSTMGWTGWQADFPDPSNFFLPILTSGAISEEGSQNHAFFSNAELDRIVASAQREQNRTKRMQLYERAEQIVGEQAPWVPVYASRVLELWHPYVVGYQPHPVRTQRFTEVWLHDAPGATAGNPSGRRAAVRLARTEEAGRW